MNFPLELLDNTLQPSLPARKLCRNFTHLLRHPPHLNLSFVPPPFRFLRVSRALARDLQNHQISSSTVVTLHRRQTTKRDARRCRRRRGITTTTPEILHLLIKQLTKSVGVRPGHLDLLPKTFKSLVPEGDRLLTFTDQTLLYNSEECFAF